MYQYASKSYFTVDYVSKLTSPNHYIDSSKRNQVKVFNYTDEDYNKFARLQSELGDEKEPLDHD